MQARSPEFVAQVGSAYRLGTQLRPLATMFGVTKDEIITLARLHGWGARAGKTAAERAGEARQAEAAREVELYNGSASDVRLLRQRGFIVTREGAGFVVGNQRCTFAQLEAKAARERRLAEAAAIRSQAVTASLRAPLSAPCSIGGGCDGAGGLACAHARASPTHARLRRLRAQRLALAGHLPEQPPARFSGGRAPAL